MEDTPTSSLHLHQVLYLQLTRRRGVIVGNRLTWSAEVLLLLEGSSECPGCIVHDGRVFTVANHNLQPQMDVLHLVVAKAIDSASETINCHDTFCQ